MGGVKCGLDERISLQGRAQADACARLGADFNQYEKKYKIDELVKELDPLIVKIVWTDENKNVLKWLDENSERIQRLIQTH